MSNYTKKAGAIWDKVAHMAMASRIEKGDMLRHKIDNIAYLIIAISPDFITIENPKTREALTLQNNEQTLSKFQHITI